MRDWARRIREGDVRAVARAATAIENRREEARGLLEELAPYAGRSRVVGITGPPGVGKSTLADRLTRVLRDRRQAVGVVSVDPSSPFSGGALLGDRIRMQEHYADPGVFIRSMATRGSMGGLARATADMAVLLAAAGKDFILIETVGVGQDEVDVARVADAVVVVLVPGMGDDVQASKAGIMEIADVFVINKADHPGVERVEREIQAVLGLAPRPDGWVPPVVRTVASEGVGISELLGALEDHRRAVVGKRRISGGRDGIGGFNLDHLGVAVRSIEGALRFWRDHLGLSADEPVTVPEEKVRITMLPAGGPRIELLEPSEPGSAVGRFLDRRGEGLHHVALRVPNLAAAVEQLRSAGVCLAGEPHYGAGGRGYVFVHPSATGGVLLELVQNDTL